MTFSITASCGCNTGRIRHNNEDNFYFNDQVLNCVNNGLDRPLSMSRPVLSGTALAVFDGMGGENFGEDASFAAADTFRHFCQSSAPSGTSESRLRNAVTQLNNAVVAKAGELVTDRMGSTLAILSFDEEQAYACNLGDSRIYLCRNRTLQQLSVDHVITPYPKKKAPLTQHLGLDPNEVLLEPSITSTPLRHGDVFVVCSDGLTDMVSDQDILSVLCEETDTEVCVRKLTESALQNGGRDNITIIVCRVSLEEPPEKSRLPLLIGIALLTVLALLLLPRALHRHRWIPATCTESAYCEKCGARGSPAHGHQWICATCTDDAFCEVCGAKGEKAAGHDWEPAIENKPKTCRICGMTEGAPISPSLSNPSDCDSSPTISEENMRMTDSDSKRLFIFRQRRSGTR